MSVEIVVANVAQAIEGRFFGKYVGFVEVNADPRRLGRLILTVPSVLGEGVKTGWALPCLPYGGSPDQGMWFIPPIKSRVWVEFEGGELSKPIWVGTFWGRPPGGDSAPVPNQAEDGKAATAVQTPPTRKIIKTQAGYQRKAD